MNKNPLMKMIQSLFYAFLVWSFSIPGYALTVTHNISPLNIEAQADYNKGDISKPAVIILHGFLTTNKFHTVQSMAEGLQAVGYTTLAPTLTLNISKRKTSVRCNSVHTHTLENDVDEIESWVNWLVSKGHKKIILVGHSSGSQEILEYLLTKKNTHIISAVFTSLFYMHEDKSYRLQPPFPFKTTVDTKPLNSLHKYSFLFCKNNYFATEKSYQSYIKLNKNYVLNGLKNLTIPTYTIMGSSDKRYLSAGEDWLGEIQKTPTNLIIIEGANHFFSSEHEFDLQDHLITVVNQLTSQ